MNENRLPDYLDHMKQAAMDACNFVVSLSNHNLTLMAASIEAPTSGL